VTTDKMANINYYCQKPAWLEEITDGIDENMSVYIYWWRFIYTVFRKKHPLTFSFISPWIICGFKQKLQWIYPRIDRFW